MSPFTVRDFQPSDYPAIADLHNATHPDEPQSASEIEREDRTFPTKYLWERIVVEVDGHVVGVGLYDQSPGMYHPRVFNVDVAVAREHRFKGIGRLVHDALLRRLEPRRPVRRFARIYAGDDVAAAFAEHRGYREVKRDVVSALDLRRFDSAPWRNVVDHVLEQGISLIPMADLTTGDPRIRAIFDLFSAVRVDAPRSMPATPIDFDYFVSEAMETPEAVREAAFFAFDGDRCIGLTQVYKSESRDELQTGMSGVDRAYRRRGIATALKVRSLMAAKALGAPSIRTDNDARNTGMLSVNRALGFEERPAQITLAWEADSNAPT